MSRARIAMLLMLLSALSALLAFVTGISNVRAAPEGAVFFEMWRTLGFLVFAGLFALLAIFPRAMPGVWELAFLHKAGMAVFAFAALPADGEAFLAGTIDAVLAAILIAGYLLTEAYRNWLTVREP